MTAADLEASRNISIIAAVSGFFVNDPVLLALRADQDKSSRWLVAFSMDSATYSSDYSSCLSLLLVFVLGTSFGVSFKALGSWIVTVLFKVAGFMSV